MDTKNRIIEFLEANKGQSVSGEYMASTLNVSRGAIWKAINGLKKEGYKITGATNRGYCLSEDSDIISVSGIAPYLRVDGTAKNISVYQILDSTNEKAKELAALGTCHGTVVIADAQSAGKGRYGRSFFSPPGHGLYISFVIHPDQFALKLRAKTHMSNDYQESYNDKLRTIITPQLFTAYAAVAVCRVIEAETGKKPQIKWVNDIFLDGMKICGILSEAVTDFESGSIGWVVVGIGINFIKPDGGFPNPISQTAGALFMDEKPTVTRNRLAAGLINEMVYSNEIHDSCGLISQYKNRLMMLGKNITVMGLKEPFSAIAIDIDDMGHLVVKKGDGEIIHLSAGEISVRI